MRTYNRLFALGLVILFLLVGCSDIKTQEENDIVNKEEKEQMNQETESISNEKAENLTLKAYQENNKWGFKDVNGIIVIEAQFDSVESFKNGTAKIKIGKYIGYIDKTGQLDLSRYENVKDKTIQRVYVDAGWCYIYDGTNKLFKLPQYDTSYLFKNSMSLIKKDNKYGFININGSVIEPQYEDVKEFSEGLAAVKKDNLYGYIDKEGTVVIEFKFREAKPFTEGLAPVEFKYRWGYIDKDGEFIVQPRYSEAQQFINGIAVVGAHNRYGYIDNKGNKITDIFFTSLERFQGNQARVKYHDYHAIIDREGNFIFDENDQFKIKKISNKYGYIIEENQLVILPKYDEAYPFKDGKALVRIQDDWKYINKAGESEELFNNNDQVKVKIGDKVGILNKNGQFVIPKNDQLKPWRYNGKSGYVTEKYDLIAYSPKFENVSKFYEGISVFGEQGKYGYIDDSGKILFEPQFSEVETFSGEDIVKVKKGNKEGFINKNGEIVIDIIFDHISEFKYGQMAEVQLNDYTGYINKQGKLLYNEGATLIPKKITSRNWGYVIENNDNLAILPQYSEAKEFINGYAVVKYDNKDNNSSQWGIINKLGKFIVEPTYNQLETMNNNIYKVEENDQWGIVDYKGETIQQTKFYEMSHLTDNIYRVIQDSKMGLINDKGETILNPMYDYIFEFKDGQAKVIKDDEYSYVDNDGNLIANYKEIEMPKQYKEMDINNLESLIDVIHNYITIVDEDTADQMIMDLINIIKEEKIPELRDQFDYGDDPKFPEKYIKNQSWRPSGGDYIFSPDYERLICLYKDEISDAYHEYLVLKNINVESPVAYDDAMLITHNELVDRTISYELYLQKHHDFELSDEIMRLYKRELGSIILGRGYFERSIIGRMPDEVYEEILNTQQNVPLTKEIIQTLVDNFENRTIKVEELNEFFDQSMDKIDSYYNELTKNTTELAVKRYINSLVGNDFKISIDKFVGMLKESEDLTIIDIRDEHEYNKGYIKNAINMPFGRKIGENIDKIPLDKQIIVIGNKWIREEQVVAIFRILGTKANRVNTNTAVLEDDSIKKYVTTEDYIIDNNQNEIDPDLHRAIIEFFENVDKNKDTIFEDFYLVGGESGIEKSDFEKFKETEGNYITVSLKDDNTGRYYSNWDVIISLDDNMYSDFKELPKDQKIFIGQVLSTQYFNKITVGLRILGYDAYGLLVAE